MRLLCVAWLTACCCLGQVTITASLVPHTAACRLLNRRAAALVSPWVGTARNGGTERVLVTEGAIIAALVGMQPFDHTAMSLLIQEASQNSLLARLGRGGQDITALGAFLAAQKNWGSPYVEVLTGVTWGAPYLVNRLRGVERPVGVNFEALSAGWPLALDAGQSAVFHAFTARQADSTPSVVLQLGVGASVRLIQ